jgi:hypothetical protein
VGGVSGYSFSAHNGKKIFNIENLSNDDRKRIVGMTANPWVGSARFLIRKGDVQLGAATHEVIVVCDKPTIEILWRFRRKELYHRNDNGIFWPERFEKLDLTKFIDAQDLL